MRTFLLALLLLCSGVASSAAQPGQGGVPDRAHVEQQLRQRMGDVVQQRLGLTQQQMQQLHAANRSFDRNRMQLLNQERRIRMAIRQEIEAGDKGSPSHLEALMDSTLLLERRRLDLMAAEQNELKKFLTPRQRAQFFGLQTQLRNRMEQMRRSRAQGPRRVPQD